MEIAKECEKILIENGINTQSSIDFEVNAEEISLRFEYIIESYM